MDQAVLRAIVAPVKLVWKSQLGKDLISTYGIDQNNATSFPGAVTAVLTLSGDLEGRVLFILTEQTAKSVEAAFNARWDEGLNQRTFDSVSDVMKPIVENIPRLLETGGHKCTAELAGVMNTKGKGVAGMKESAEVIMLASLPDFDNPSTKDEISVWVMLEPGDADHGSGPSGDDHYEQDEFIPEDDAEEAGALAASGAGIRPDESLSQNEAAILSELHEEFEEIPETNLISDQDVAEMMAEEALTADKSESGDGEDEEQVGLSEQEEPALDPEKSYPAIYAGVITTEKLEIVDSDGKVRSVLATLRDGSPYLSIADSTGRIRATLRLDSEGEARLTFVDETGAETWMAPRDELPAREAEQARQRAPAAPKVRKSESTGPSSKASSNGRKSRPKADSAPSNRKPGGLKASPGRKPSRKSRAESTSGKKSKTDVAERSRRGPPKTADKSPGRRKVARPAAVR